MQCESEDVLNPVYRASYEDEGTLEEEQATGVLTRSLLLPLLLLLLQYLTDTDHE